MHIDALETPHALFCPHCRQALAVIEARAMSSASDGYFLLDGDSVPGASAAVGLSGAEGFDASVVAGECHSCKGGYYVVDATFVDGDIDDLVDWFSAEKDDLEYAFTVVRGATQTWVHMRTTTEGGLAVNEHTFGPFPLEPGCLIGPAGVSACGERACAKPWQHARDLLAAHWEPMGEINGLVAA